MKNKKNIYILLPVVLLIWGSVIYKFFSFSDSDEIVAGTQQEVKFKPLRIKKTDTVSHLDTDFRDPFLGHVYSSETVPSDKTKKVIQQKKVEKSIEPLHWPQIIYKGIVSDTKEKTKIFMLVINGKTFLMKKGNTEEEVFLKDGDRKLVYVKYKGELNIILQQE